MDAGPRSAPCPPARARIRRGLSHWPLDIPCSLAHSSALSRCFYFQGYFEDTYSFSFGFAISLLISEAVNTYMCIYIFLVFQRLFFFFSFPFHSQFVCPQMTLIWTRTTGSGSRESPLIKPGASACCLVAPRKQSFGGSLEARGGGRPFGGKRWEGGGFFFLNKCLFVFLRR